MIRAGLVASARMSRTAFGVDGEPEPLAGGQGLAWRVGDLVIKPEDLAPEELAWQADVLPAVDARDVRLSFPHRTIDGELMVDGWTAWTYLVGEHRDGSVAGHHRRRRSIPPGHRRARAARVRRRADASPWAIGDRVAWARHPSSPYRDVPHVVRLAERLAPVDGAEPADPRRPDRQRPVRRGSAPAVIDLSLYWRPPAFATAIVVADALVWEGADESLLELIADVDDFGQMLVRALLYRLVAAVEGGFEDDEAAIDRRYGRDRRDGRRARHPIDIAGA